jgi:GNAT superfamily N-acetyltransferase
METSARVEPLFEVHPITAPEALPLRHAILRAGLPRETAIFPNDEAHTSRHFGAFVEGKLVGVATMHFVPLLDQPDFDPAYQVRGMATAPEMQGRGVGRALLEACIDAAREAGAQWLWCNARTPALGFYSREGFTTRGGVFDIPTAGPHVRMLRPL